MWPAPRWGHLRREARMGVRARGSGSRYMRESRTGEGLDPISPLGSTPKGARALTAVRGCFSMAPRPAPAGAQRKLLGWPLQAGQGSALQCPLSFTLWRGASVPGRQLCPLSRGLFASLARLLLDSSPHSLFPALRAPTSSRVQARPFFESRRGHGTLPRLLTPCPAHSEPGPGPQAFAGASLTGPAFSLMARKVFGLRLQQPKGNQEHRAPLPGRCFLLVCSPSLAGYLLCTSWFWPRGG